MLSIRFARFTCFAVLVEHTMNTLTTQRLIVVYMLRRESSVLLENDFYGQ